MGVYVFGKEDEKLWEIVLELDFLTKAGRVLYQDSAFQPSPLSIPNERGVHAHP